MRMRKDPDMYSSYPRPDWPGPRMPVEPCGLQQDARLHDQCSPRPNYPMTVGNFLKYCGIEAKSFFLIVVTDHGIDYYAGPHEVHNPERLFDKDTFLQTQGQAGFIASSSPAEENLYDGNVRAHVPAGSFGPRVRPITIPYRPAQSDGRGSPSPKSNKRPRTTEQAAPQTSKRSIRIDDADALKEFYDQRFKRCQQTACKVIAKAWIKAVEPRKQSTYPYTKDVAPSWWPRPWGSGERQRVRHKEPDHLWKFERLVLLPHILQMIVEPKGTQHSAVLNAGLDVGKLEKTTMESLEAFFEDKDRPRNAEKRVYLKEIFRVAKCEQRYKNGEIDGETQVQVLADDKLPADSQSDDDDADEEDELIQSMIPSRGSSSPPSHEQQHPPAASPVPEGHYMSQIQLASNMGAAGAIRTGHHHNSYGEVAPHPHALPLPVPSDTVVPGHTSLGRRPPPMFGPADFNPTPQPNMYMNGWSSTTAPTTASIYAFTPQPQQSTQQTHSAGSFMAHTNVALGPTPTTYLPPTFDAMGRQYDSGQSHMFRGHPIPPAVSHPNGLPNFTPDDRLNQSRPYLENLGISTLHRYENKEGTSREEDG